MLIFFFFFLIMRVKYEKTLKTTGLMIWHQLILKCLILPCLCFCKYLFSYLVMGGKI